MDCVIENAYELNNKNHFIVRMSYMSDIIMLGLVLTLLFGSICLYLYTRIQQIEQKLELTESILLEFKMTSEFNKMDSTKELSSASTPLRHGETDNSDQEGVQDHTLSVGPVSYDSATPPVEVRPFVEQVEGVGEIQTTIEVKGGEPESVQIILDQATSEQEIQLMPEIEEITVLENFTESNVNVNYEAMTLKELKFLAEKKGIAKISTLRRPQLLEAIREFDQKSISNPL